MMALPGPYRAILVEQQPHAIPRATENVSRAHCLQRDQWMLSHELAIQREFYRADFLPCTDGCDQWLLEFHFCFEFVGLIFWKRKVNVLTEPGLEFILATFPYLNSGNLPLLRV